MLLKIDEQIRPALHRGQQAKTTASPEWRSSLLSKRAMVDLNWQPRRRLEDFSDEVKRHLSMFRQSLHATGGGKDGSHGYRQYEEASRYV
jgi:hypothetical protein